MFITGPIYQERRYLYWNGAPVITEHVHALYLKVPRQQQQRFAWYFSEILAISQTFHPIKPHDDK